MTITATFSNGKTITKNTNRKVSVAWGLRASSSCEGFQEGEFLCACGFSREIKSAKRTASQMRKATGFKPHEVTIEIVDVKVLA